MIALPTVTLSETRRAWRLSVWCTHFGTYFGRADAAPDFRLESRGSNAVETLERLRAEVDTFDRTFDRLD